MSQKETPRTYWYIHGLVKINREPEGYSLITPISRGRAHPILKIPDGTPHGWKLLTAIYSDDDKETYLNSIRRTRVYYGTKVWINSPCTVYDENERTVTLKADLFAHNRRVPIGYGRFFIGKVRVSEDRVNVVNGYAEQTINLDDFPDLTIVDGMEYSFKYALQEEYELSPDNGYGKIFVQTTPEGKTKLKVEVVPIIMNKGEKQKLIARVYHANYSGYVKSPADIPQDGTVIFYIDSKRVGESSLAESGFAMINYIAKDIEGTHNITAIYVPSEDLEWKYQKTVGCGTLFVGDDKNKPTLTVNSPLCTNIGVDDKPLSFTFSKAINGTIQLFMDLEPLMLVGSSPPNYELTFNNTKSVTVHFDSLGKVSDTNKHWLYGGDHNLILKYTTDDGLKYSPTDTVTHPMEYWYYLDYFYIRIPVELELIGDLDNIMGNDDNGNEVFTGNNIFYIYDTSDKKEWYKHYKPSLDERSRSTTVGNKIQVRIKNKENPNRLIQGGYVRFTFATRTKNNNLEDNITKRGNNVVMKERQEGGNS